MPASRPSRSSFLLRAACSLALVAAWLPCLAHPEIDRQIADVTARLAAAPDDPLLYLRRGELHRIHLDWELAAADFRRAAAVEPDLAVVDFHLGRLHLDAGKPEEARVALDRFLAVEPSHAEARTTRARALVELGRHLDAAADWDAALAVPGVRALPEDYLGRARALEAAGSRHLGRALAGIEDGIVRLGRPVTLELHAIEIEERMGRIDAAVARIDRLAAGAARREGWLLRKGELLERAGRTAEARTAYGQAIAAIDGSMGSRRATRASSRLREEAAAALARLEAGP
jgi:tetratricopeptide (TPR) repeat protein